MLAGLSVIKKKRCKLKVVTKKKVKLKAGATQALLWSCMIGSCSSRGPARGADEVSLHWLDVIAALCI
jgi:hypothetical protein